jgi:hypothetical protein
MAAQELANILREPNLETTADDQNQQKRAKFIQWVLAVPGLLSHLVS